MVGAHGAVIGRYERDEVKPSIEMATQLAAALEVSLDYLVGAIDACLHRTFSFRNESFHHYLGRVLALRD